MGHISSCMAGNVFKLLVKTGDIVESGDEVVILESMKMEIPITVESKAVIKDVKVREGEFVNEGDIIIELE
ncbi:acetyl-CoA carboxylase biotin carboxyl carrier protein subunit [Neobacillus bataviensis]|uniref:acetyl-CoA carboxylase biotin carboxyl carrier protein subunit n=1 Tax=Neobacillus bataviensis TaxID=220685 RepID=UPI001CBFF98F|nr:acetyl-CoA carboxylase biotin carboxyl carrier protein subunit [Neobacillus bataviensis]